MKAVVMNDTGDREMLEYVERPDPVPGPGEALPQRSTKLTHFCSWKRTHRVHSESWI